MTPTRHTPHQDQDDLLRIVGDLGRVNTQTGMQPGTGAIRLELSPLQLTRLAQELSAEAIQALGLALHFGEIRTGPIRVEIVGWSRNWLIEHGMAKNAAQRAAKQLRDRGLTSVAYGPEGPFGPRLAVLNGGRFGWDKPVVEQVRDGRPAHRPTPPAPLTGPVNPQVSTLDRKPVKQSDHPVDNSLPLSDRFPVRQSNVDVDNPYQVLDREPVRHGTHTDPPAPVGPANLQVSTLDWILARQPDGPSTTRSSKEEKERLPSFSWSGGTLTRTDLDQFLLGADLGEALRARRSEGVAVLTVALAGAPDRVRAALTYLDAPTAENPESQLAGLLVDLLAVPSGTRAGTAGRLLQVLRTKGAHVPAMAPDDVIAGMVCTLVSSLAADPRQWNGWMVSGLKRVEWTSSAPLVRVLDALTTMVTGVAAPAESSARTSGGIPMGVDGPGGSVDDPDYVADLRQAVAGTPDADEVMFDTLLRNPRRQALVLMRYQQRARKQAIAAAEAAQEPAIDAG